MSESASSFIFAELSGEVAAIERKQPLPVPLGGVAVVDRAFWKRKSVMGAGKHLDLVAGPLHAGAHLLDDLRRRIDVGLGAGEIKLGLGLVSGKMRTVRLIG